MDTTIECVRSLKVLGEPVQAWDSILLHIMKSKVDQETRRQWELSLKGTDQPTFAEFNGFLEQRARALTATQSCSGKNKIQPPATTGSRLHCGTQKSSTNSYHGAIQECCVICKGKHPMYKCTTFLRMSVGERRKLTRKYSLCFNCLRHDHHVNNCKAGHCKRCSYKHNTLLHPEENQQHVERQSSNKDNRVMSHISREIKGCNQVLLSTTIVKVRDSSGLCQYFRALLDSASQASFISEHGAERLQLKRKKSDIAVTGLGSSRIRISRGIMEIVLESTVDASVKIRCEVLILPKVTNWLPSLPCKNHRWSHIQGLTLADPQFHTPGEIDMLLGADVYHELMLVGKCQGPPGTPTAFKTVFGWALSGPIMTESHNRLVQVNHCHIDDQLQQFWKIEELPSTTHLTEEEAKCEDHFVQTHSRDETGRYIVRLPRRSEVVLGESRDCAVTRLLQVERQLKSNTDRCELYRNFMQEYLSLGHMEPIVTTESSQDNHDTVYLPHHSVMKQSSTTTKLRVVFNASAKTTTGMALNDVLLVGAKLQDDLVSLLIRFRLHIVAMTADIEKMYRQIRIHPEECDLQRIVWRSSPDGAIEDYRLTTLTYGTAAAPFLATRVLQQLSEDEGEAFPMAATVIKKDLYMDDVMSGADTTSEAVKLQGELIQLARKGGFELRKWSSNDAALLDTLPNEMIEGNDLFQINADGSVKTLGLHWHPVTDQFSFIVSLSDNCPVTKRVMLSDIARIFDPLGLLSPIVITAKLMLQRLWQEKLEWDDIVPTPLRKQWETFREGLNVVNQLRISRCVSQSNYISVSLQGFCDASEKAYAAVVYLRTVSPDKSVQCHLWAAKTKVAPLKSVTLPRLELCAAVLLTRVIKTIQASLRTPITDIQAWSDSTVVLAWLKSSPHRWKTFVSNRVAEIQESLPSAHWHHVTSGENAADCASRGMLGPELQEHSLWWHGPEFLKLSTNLDNPSCDEPAECNVEQRKIVPVVAHQQVDKNLLLACSSLTKLRRITAYVQRFIYNAKSPLHTRKTESLTARELDDALNYWIRVVQEEEFYDERQQLRSGEPLSCKSKILSLHPFLDNNGIMRVGGRLQHASMTVDRKHPIILSKNNHLSFLLIQYEHIKQLHGGCQLVVTTLRERFWIIGARDAVRYHIRRCIPCVRQRAQTAYQFMGNLPAARVNQARPFAKCGVDYAGPIQLKILKGRGRKTFKAYIVVFVCFVTRAFHLELASDMSTDAFLAALKRFVARRGRSSEIYSDRGTNFVGAARELKELLQLVSSQAHIEQVAKWMAEEGIMWRFNPPAAPHFGGLWEAGVKSVKYHLRRVVGDTILTFEEMQTLLCQIEACLNSRPLSAMSSDPSDLNALTPGHFLIGEALSSIPEPDLQNVPMNRLSRWQLGQKLLQHFWKRWRGEYLGRLQQRPKWLKQQRNFSVGDLVLIKDDGLPPIKWKMGRIVDVHAGTDGFVRVVTVRTADKEIKRPIVKLCLLPLE